MLVYLVSSCLEACFFSEERRVGEWVWRRRKVQGGGVEDLGGLEGRDSVVGMYCIRKKNSIFNLKKSKGKETLKCNK